MLSNVPIHFMKMINEAYDDSPKPSPVEEIEASRHDLIKHMDQANRIYVIGMEPIKIYAAISTASTLMAGNNALAGLWGLSYCVASFYQASTIRDCKEQANRNAVERGDGYWYDPRSRQVAKKVRFPI